MGFGALCSGAAAAGENVDHLDKSVFDACEKKKRRSRNFDPKLRVRRYARIKVLQLEIDICRFLVGPVYLITN